MWNHRIKWHFLQVSFFAIAYSSWQRELSFWQLTLPSLHSPIARIAMRYVGQNYRMLEDESAKAIFHLLSHKCPNFDASEENADTVSHVWITILVKQPPIESSKINWVRRIPGLIKSPHKKIEGTNLPRIWKFTKTVAPKTTNDPDVFPPKKCVPQLPWRSGWRSKPFA